jgi:hypothetical protein
MIIDVILGAAIAGIPLFGLGYVLGRHHVLSYLKKGAAHHRVAATPLAPSSPSSLLDDFILSRFGSLRVTEETRTHTSTAVPASYKCPVENCRIKTRHSHTEDFVRRVREK